MLQEPVRGPHWRRMVETQEPDRPGWDPETFERIAQLLERFHALPPFERREPGFRILAELAGWARRVEGASSPYERLLLSLWHPTQSWLQGSYADLFAGEAAIVTSLDRGRFVTMQGLGPSLGLVLFHRTSWGVGAAVLLPGSATADAVWSVIHAFGRQLRGGWAGPETGAWIAGGWAGQDEGRVGEMVGTLKEARIPEEAIRTSWCLRSREDGPLFFAFDRQEGRGRAFHPGFDPVQYNLRTRADRERCRVEQEATEPQLLWLLEIPR